MEAVDAAEPWPGVSVVMPVLDEERHLGEAVDRILRQGYPGELEVVLALGPSRDATDAVAAELARREPRVRLVPNPTGRTPAGLNAAVAASRHDVVVRVDGHGLLTDGYIAAAVRLLQRTGADNVGGIMAAEGETDVERAVAAAMTSRLGIGNARFHVGGSAGPAESVYLGVFRRATLERLGGFDESFVRAQDWELNHRIRQAGGTVWFSPELTVTYRPRSSLRALARQFYRTGQWRRQVMQRYPGTVSARYLAPPVATAAVVAGTLAGLLGLRPGWRVARWGWAAPVGYAAVVAVGALADSRPLPPGARARLPVVLATMHLSWGAGFWRGAERAQVSPRSAGT